MQGFWSCLWFSSSNTLSTMTQASLVAVLLLTFVSACSGVCHPASQMEEIFTKLEQDPHFPKEYFTSKYWSPNAQIILNGKTFTPAQYLAQFDTVLKVVKSFKFTVNSMECQENWCYIDYMFSNIAEHAAGDLLVHEIRTLDDDCKTVYQVMVTDSRVMGDLVQKLLGGKHKDEL